MNNFGAYMGKNITNNVAGEIVDNAKMNLKEAQNKIEWHNYNWPPLVKMFHFKSDECEPDYKPIVKRVHWSWRIILGLIIFNFINAIIQTASGFTGWRILSSICVGLIYGIIMTYAVYALFRHFVADDSKSLIYFKIVYILMDL